MDFENSSCQPLLKSISGKAVYIKSYIMSWKCIYSLTTNKHNRQFHWWQSHGMFWLQIFYLCVTFLIKTGHFFSKTTQILFVTLNKKRKHCPDSRVSWEIPSILCTPYFSELVWPADQNSFQLSIIESSLSGRSHIYPVTVLWREPSPNAFWILL